MSRKRQNEKQARREELSRLYAIRMVETPQGIFEGRIVRVGENFFRTPAWEIEVNKEGRTDPSVPDRVTICGTNCFDSEHYKLGKEHIKVGVVVSFKFSVFMGILTAKEVKLSNIEAAKRGEDNGEKKTGQETSGYLSAF